MSDDPLRTFDGIVRRLTIGGAPIETLVGTTFVAKDLYDIQGSVLCLPTAWTIAPLKRASVEDLT
jgi:hypothetical protein